MLCSEASMVNSGWDGVQAVLLRCRSWGCPNCYESRRKQLMALARSGDPNTFITLTVNPAFGSSPFDRARRLADAWRVIVRLVKAKYELKELEYFCVFEATLKGEPHLHILCRVKWISQKWLSEQMEALMMAPIVDIRRVRDKGKLAYYVSKYCGKEPHRFSTCKRYWTTRGYELTKFEPEPPPGRWHNDWQLLKVHISQLADEWRDQGFEVTETRNRVLGWRQGPPDDEIAEYEHILWRRRKGLPW